MRKRIHNLLKGISLTAALFVFQACYGTPVPPPAEELEAEEGTELVDQTLESAENVAEQTLPAVQE